MFPRRLVLLAFICCARAGSTAQSDTLATGPWVDREFRYWRGRPMMHGPNDECIAGYTDEERTLFFFSDHRYQEFVFEDRGTIEIIWEPGTCPPLEGDTVDVAVERTAQYALDPVLEKYIYRRQGAPVELPISPSRVCLTQQERTFWFEGERLAEAVRVWD
jgi:hypothetical protein